MTPDKQLDAQVALPSAPSSILARKRAKPRKSFTSKPVVLSINSLLDILSTVLLFLLKSYSTDSITIKPSAELQVPMSHSALTVVQSTAVTITTNKVMVNDVPVVTLKDGDIAPEELGADGFLITPLFQKLNDELEYAKKVSQYNDKSEVKDIVTIIGDRNMSFSLLTKVMYTAGQASFGKFKFAAIKAPR